MKYKKGNTVTIKTHEEMLADPDIKCWYTGNERKPGKFRTYSCEGEWGNLILMNAEANKVLGSTQKIVAVTALGYEVEGCEFPVEDWMVKDA